MITQKMQAFPTQCYYMLLSGFFFKMKQHQLFVQIEESALLSRFNLRKQLFASLIKNALPQCVAKAFTCI